MEKTKSTQLNCFSPPVMLATLIVEVSLAAYTVWRYKMNSLIRLAAIFLIALATFQLAEYFVCTGDSNVVQWSRLGFVAITALPPLGLHILHELAGKPNRKLVTTSYVTMASFMAFFLLTQSAFTGHECTGNYVIFQLSPHISGLYSIYYFGWLLTGIGLGLKWMQELSKQNKNVIKKFEAVRGLVIGYFVFLIPTAVANTVKPETRRGIPSILCGFAVLLALILVLYVLPRVAQPKVVADSKA